MAGRQATRGVLAVGVPVLLVAAVLLHAWHYLPFIDDDALISLRYADRLLAGEGLTWTSGERVEGYSNLLWVLACAGLGALGLDLVTAARALGLASAAAAVVAIAAAHPPRPGRVAPALAGGLSLAFSGTLAVWAVGGLEQPLFAALLAWAFVTAYPLLDAAEVDARSAAVPGLLLGLAALTRVDGALVAAGAAAGVVWARGRDRRGLRAAALLAAIPVLAVVAQIAFRRAYYGELVPNPARVKLAWTSARLVTGLGFVGAGLLANGALVLVAPFGAACAPRRARLLAPSLALWAVYVVIIGGGDQMPARRQMAPIVVVLALLVAEAGALVHRAEARRRAALLAVLVAAHGAVQLADPQNRRASIALWARDAEPVGALLAGAFASRAPLLAVDAAGGLPYFSRLPALDMLGLCDRHIARQRPADFGEGTVGHELGDGRYVLSRRPDLVVFCVHASKGRPCYPGGFDLFREDEFRARYRLVTFEADRVRSRIWVRAEGGRLGIERSAERVVVPGFLAASSPETPARLEGGALVAIATSAQPAALLDLDLPAGRWRALLDATGAEPSVAIVGRRSGHVLGRGARAADLVTDGVEHVDLHVAAGAGEAFVARIELVRLGPPE